MGKGGSVRANLHATRTQINNARTSAQTRAFKARQIAKQKRDAEERKLRATQAAAAKAATAPAATTGDATNDSTSYSTTRSEASAEERTE